MKYTGNDAFDRVLYSSIGMTLIMLLNAKYMKRAPYGKFGGRQENVINLDPRFGWWLMELPATLSFLYNYYRGLQEKRQD